jgi:hypothetical protein
MRVCCIAALQLPMPLLFGNNILLLFEKNVEPFANIAFCGILEKKYLWMANSNLQL